MKQYLLGIDIGTGGAKALLIDGDGGVAARGFSSYPLATPRPFWAEQEPEDWWRATTLAIMNVLSHAGATPAAIACIGLTGQMHGLVALDRAGTALRPCILWNDQRCAAQCDEMTERIGASNVIATTGKPFLPGFTAPKILWMREHEPEPYGRIATILLPKDYIRYRLTGTYFSEVTDASGTSLLDVGRRSWSPEFAAAFGIPMQWLPEVTESPDVSAFVSADAAAQTGIAAGTPVVGGAGDQAAEAVGCGVLGQGAVSVTIGTSGVVFTGMDAYAPDREGRVHAYCHALPDTWHLMGVMLSAGGSFRWFRDTFADMEKEKAQEVGIDVYDLLTEHAALIPAGSDGLFFLPYLTGERTPHPDPYARGAFIGITLRHRKHHFTRAILEGVGYGLKDSLMLMRGLGVTFDRVLVSGGGARSEHWLQVLADIFGTEVCTVNVTEGAAYGAALLAGVGAGIWPDVRSAAESTVRVTGSTAPGQNAQVYRQLYESYRALYPALKAEFRSIAGAPGEGRIP